MKRIYLFILCFAGLFNLKAQHIFFANPYLQLGDKPSERSLQLLWQTTDTSASWGVEYKNQNSDKWIASTLVNFSIVAVKGIVEHRVYHSVLDQLEPGLNFNYKVFKNGKVVFTAEAKSPRSAKQDYRFVAFGDIGAETHDQKQLAIRAYNAKPDFVVIPGDIVYEYGRIGEYQKKFWPVYNASQPDSNGAPIMCSVPFIAAMGNHDAESRDLDKEPDALAYYEYWSQPLNGIESIEGGPVYPLLKGNDVNKSAFLQAAGANYPKMSNFSFNYGNAHWTVLDSDTYVDWTNDDLKQWVTMDLEASKEKTWHFIMFHHPGFNSSREHYEQQQMRLLSPIFEKGKVDVVFCGHVHNYQRSFPLKFTPDKKGTLLVAGKDNKVIRGRVVNGRWVLDKNFDGKTKTVANGIIYLITGAGGQELYNPEQNDDADSWQKFTNKFFSKVHSLTIVDVKGKSISFQQLSAEGKILDSFKLTKP